MAQPLRRTNYGSVSIRAPVRGRCSMVFPPVWFQPFQSAPPCGGDGQRVAVRQHKTRFNPRPRAGAMYTRGDGRAPFNRFNPRPRAGAMFPLLGNKQQQTTFRSAPPCGGDGHQGLQSGFYSSFNPRPRAGAMQPLRETEDYGNVSIRAPVRGRWCVSSDPERTPLAFQSAPPCGGDDGLVVTIETEGQFQSSPPCGGDENRSSLSW